MSEPSFEAAAPQETYVETPVEPASAATQKQGMNVYTLMLVISFVCLLVGTILLFSEFQRFGGWQTESAVPQEARLIIQSPAHELLA